MAKKLKISIGSHRNQVEVAHVNDSSKPTIINSDLFVGRVLVKIRDFDGITPDGSIPIRDHLYFDGRSRRFDIQIEGRFKRRDGVPLYSGEEIHFGSDFDHLVEFPKSAFNAGMRVARWIDPNTFYDLSPSSGRPFIMSPYLACMNTLCAWPAPNRMSDALVCLRQSHREDDDIDEDEGEDLVPIEEVNRSDIGGSAGNKKIGRHTKRYWRFIGLKGDGTKIDAFLEKNRDLLVERPVVNTEEDQGPSAIQITHDSDGNEDEEDDDGNSCHAPSSHATYSTALEGRPPLSSASSYRFSPRIFPRHQISFGAGMRDLYQDAETEAKEREGEARAQESPDSVGEDGLIICSPIPPRPDEVTRLPSNQSGDSEEAKKSHSVKNRLKKLKTAFQKLTPTGLSSSTSSSSLGGTSSSTASPPNNNKFSTVIYPKQSKRFTGTDAGTVSRAASRTLPFTRRSRNSSGTQATSTSVTPPTPPSVKGVCRSRTLATRPVSQPPGTMMEAVTSKLRSTSFDHNKSDRPKLEKLTEARTSHDQTNDHNIISSPNQSPQTAPAGEPTAPPRDLFISTDTAALHTVGSEHAESIRVSSPSTYHHSDELSEDTSATTASNNAPDAGTSPQPQQTLKMDRNGTNSHSSTTTMRANGVAQEAGHLAVPLSGSEGERYRSLSSNSSIDTSTTNTMTTNSDTDSMASPPTQPPPKQITQADIDNAPELKDVKKGDLMFGDMLNLAEDPFQDSVSGELGAWRFRNPTTDILEDNTFVFLNKSVDVQKRRKYFSESYGKHRKEFTYDPDVVYATSFFSPFMNFNTFDLAIGPVKMNVAKIFGDMPIRYTLRSTRIVDGTDEEEVFVTIAFELVDE